MAFNNPADGAGQSALQPGMGSTDPPGMGAPGESISQFITFRLGGEDYGVDIMAVREIKGWAQTTPIPNAPPYIQGVINLRGIIVPIMDLRARFGMETTAPTQKHVVIIVTIAARTTGLLVDAVSDIVSVPGTAIRPIPDMGTDGREDLLSGLVAIDSRMVSLVALQELIGGCSEDAARQDHLQPAA